LLYPPHPEEEGGGEGVKWMAVGIIAVLSVIVLSINYAINDYVHIWLWLSFLPFLFIGAIAVLVFAYEVETEMVRLCKDRCAILPSFAYTFLGILATAISIWLISDMGVYSWDGVVSLFIGTCLLSVGLSCTYVMIKSKKEVKE